MKFLYKSMYSALLMGAMGLNATAQQQLPNSGFEEEWINCVPWTSNGNSKDIGSTPSGWCISQVIGVSGLGKTEVGFKTEGYNSATAVELKNSPNSFLSTQTVPGYITLGKTWSTSVMGNKNDGGSFGGIEFSGRPESLEFMYKHTGTDGEKATVVAYLWKGHWTQKAVPGNIVAFGSPKTADMVDRDRCVLGLDMSSSLGGAVTHSDDAELIAVINVEIEDETTTISEDNNGWKKFSAKFDYKSDATPEMINVVLAAGNYFGGATAVKQGTSLIVDDVKLIYAENDKNVYPGVLNIEMLGNNLASNKPATIEITPAGEGKCTFTLPNFVLEMAGEEPIVLGDIVVNDVTTSEENGVTTYNGDVKGLQLAGGTIVADVTLNGTISGNNVVMNIDVMWSGIPIKVTFTSTTSGITDITVDNSNAPVEFYNLQGVRVNADNLTPGIYVRRQGSQVSKVLVK
ncbi:calycin-like domain-containing protein [Duncaniella muris]|uniref:calycin-like domain-containing protein n=1 Tax=Duncaniella muris TaxID=2094150 RepID=UPI0025AA0D1F|nr:calycin-like domain-containing protein [Duncaniella muris]